jgi:tetratricopeptide (TPR) repeat protein
MRLRNLQITSTKIIHHQPNNTGTSFCSNRLHTMSDSSDLQNQALRCIDNRDYDGAIGILEKAGNPPLNAECLALLGLAYYQRQQYDEAAKRYAAALQQDATNQDWQEMLHRANANTTAEVHVFVPDRQYFVRDVLLAPSVIPPGELPTSGSTPRQPRWEEKIRRKLGTVVGWVATGLMYVATYSWGAVFVYRGIWTNWYRRRLYSGILTLAYMREKLNKRNLVNTYPEGKLIGFQPEGQEPPEGVRFFRTADGSWNNLANPKEGAAGTRFLLNVDPSAVRPETGEKLITPNPREISRKLLKREGPMKEVEFLNLLAAVWIQFQTHGWINHGEILKDFHEIPLAPDDPARRQYHQTKMFVGKTQPDPTRMPEDKVAATFINEVTHWWDGSQIYGSNFQTQKRLRSLVDGKMKLAEDGTLPVDKKGLEEVGFQRNWWVGLAMLHTLFVKEHNAICDRLKIFYPQWDDNRLFNVARLINAAVMAKIHTVEWTPAILPNKGLNMALNANWFGILTNLCAYGKDRDTLSEIKVKNPEMGGVVGNPIDKHGQPYGLTEEFVEVYRLHSLLPETLRLQKIDQSQTTEVATPATRQAGSPKITKKFGIADLLFSFGNQSPGQLVLNNYPRFMQELSIPGNPLFDMGAVDILRARERGVPRYNEFRQKLGLKPISAFDDLTTDQAQVKKLKEVYGDKPQDVDKLDLMIGTLAEGKENRPAGFGFGETMFQIFILNATRRLQADRFYTDNYNEATYTREGLDWIDSSTFKTVLLRNYPELAATGLANVTNAFEPWDTDENLNPLRHPLRAYEPELGKNPWQGDKFRV